MKTIALLTGRGNNTLKDKNIIEVLGHPILYYPANSGKKAKDIDSFYCSSDDEKILREAEKIGYKRIVRPKELAKPDSQHIHCVLHALEVIKKDSGLPDIVVVLLANNVTVNSKWISDCVDIMKRDMSISAVVPVYLDNDHHPLRAKTLNDDGTLTMYVKNVKGMVSTNRQDLPKCYFLAHNFWVINVQKMIMDPYGGQQPWGFMGNKIMPYFIDESIDIHKSSDLNIASEWIKNNYED